MQTISMPAAIIGSLLLFGCNDQRGKVEHSDTFGVASDLAQLSPEQFLSKPTHSAKVLHKLVESWVDRGAGKTNVFATVILQDENGRRLAVSSWTATSNFAAAVQALEKNGTYQMPDALRR